MSFEAIAAMISGKRPIWLYEFAKGNARWYFTALRDAVIEPPIFWSRPYYFTSDPLFFTREWNPRAISHGKIPQAQNSYRSELTITLPLSDEFARTFLAPIGAVQTRVTIWHGFANDTDNERVVKYKGRIIGAKANEAGTIGLICQSELATLDRKALPAVMQRPCRHALYGTGCGLALGDWQTSATVTVVSNNGLNLTVPVAASSDDNYFRGGVIEFDGAQEMITAHTGTALTLAARLPGLADEIDAEGSAAVQIAPGCDLSTANCGIFDNILNFGGAPFMADTPFDGRSIL